MGCFYAVAEGACADDRVALDLDGSGVEGRGFVRICAVERIADDAVRRNTDGYCIFARQRTLVQTAGDIKRRRFGIARKAQTVLRSGGRGGIIEKTRLPERSAVRGIVIKLRNDNFV